MSLKNIGDLGEYASSLKNASSYISLVQSGTVTDKQRTAFKTLRDSLDGLKIEDAVKKLQDLKLDPDLSKEILNAANNMKLFDGSAEEIAAAINNFQQPTSLVQNLSSAFSGLLATVKPVLAALATNPLTWLVAIGAATVALEDLLTVDYSEANEAFKESSQRYTESKQALESLNNELSTNEERQKELQALKDNGAITASELEELNLLETKNTELERKIALQERLNSLEAEGAMDNAKEASTKESHSVAQSVKSGDETGQKNFKGIVGKVTDAEAINEDLSLIEEYEKKIPDLEKKIALAKKKSQGQSGFGKLISGIEIKDMESSLEHYKASLKTLQTDLISRSENAQSQLDILRLDPVKNADEIKVLEDALGQINQEIISANNSLETLETSSNDLSFSETLSEVEALSKGLDQLSQIYADVKDGETFDFSSILNNAEFKESFGDLGEDYENFIQTVTKSPDDIDACQGAFDDLAAKYIENSGVLNDLTEETKASTIAMLKQMGVANAEEVVTNALAKAKIRLAAEEEYLTASKELAEIKSNDLSNATYEEISALLSEGYASETTRQYLAQLALSKFNVNSININTQSDIDNIIALANAAGASTQYVNALETALNNLQNVKTTKSIAKNYLTTEGQFYIKSNKEAWAQEVATDAEFNARKALQNVLSSINENKLNASDFYTSINYQGGSASNTSSSSAQETKETFNWIETALSRIQRTITNLGKSVSATWKSWGTRNSDLAKQISAVNKELSLQQQAYNKYIALANSVGLSDYYKNLVHSGSIQYETITNASLAEKIKEYQDFYEQALSCEDAILDLKDELASLAQTNFDNITKQFEDKLSLIDHELGMLESTADLLETQGYIRSASIYDSLAQYEQENLNNLQSKYFSLMDALNNSGIEKGTEQWNDMYIEVLGVKEELLESQKALAKYNNTLQELNWEVFDKLQEKISGIRDESEFLIDLMANDKMFDDKGNLTEQGQATLGLHAMNYNTYMAQAEEYAKELEQVNADLAKDPYNQTLLERRDELLEQQREMIQAAEDEKESAIDLASEGYDTLLEYMDQLIEKRKDMLLQAKDLYDYEKNIAEQTKEVASLEKQLAVYHGDDSEESRATIQKLKVSLEEARENLEETEYDKYISDQERMLDSLYSEAEEWINTRLDNEDLLLQNIIDSAKTNSVSIMETLKTVTDEVGTTLSDKMEAIWSANGSVGSAITMIKDYLTGMQEDAEERTDEIQASTEPSPDSTPSNSTPTPGTSADTTASSSTTSSSWGSFFIKKTDSYPKGKLNINTSIVDRLKYNDIDSSFSARSQYYNAMGGSGVYTGILKVLQVGKFKGCTSQLFLHKSK